MSRSSEDQAYERTIKTEVMQSWDSAVGDKAKVLVVGATNRPQDLDAAIQRRFDQSYLIGM